MKKLYFVRHAKSSWKDSTLNDFDRPLNKRGKRDAPFMGKLLKERGIKPELIISSSAVRTTSTALFFAEGMNYPPYDIIKDDNLYEAGSRDILNIIVAIEDTINSLMIFAHNPGITELYNFLSKKKIDNIPTSAVVSLTFKVDHWTQIDINTSSLDFFEYPKKYFK